MHHSKDNWIFWVLLVFVLFAAVGWKWWMFLALIWIIPAISGRGWCHWGAEHDNAYAEKPKRKRKNDEKPKNDFI